VQYAAHQRIVNRHTCIYRFAAIFQLANTSFPLKMNSITLVTILFLASLDFSINDFGDLVCQAP